MSRPLIPTLTRALASTRPLIPTLTRALAHPHPSPSLFTLTLTLALSTPAPAQVRLGFVPAGQEAAATSSGVVELLTYTYSKRAEGGGFANFDVPALFDELRSLSAQAGS